MPKKTQPKKVGKPSSKPAAMKSAKGELSEKQLDKVAGGMRMSSDQCKETEDTGVMGCPS